MTDTITRDCHAKVNLFLRVLARESDGYHNIETLFCRAGLHDSLEIRRTAGGISLDVTGAELGPPEENLVWRAAEAALSTTGRRFGVAMHLTKRIPAGGGLGGGSSDAAEALLGVNALADHRIPAAEILNLAARLGSDIPFFATGADAALAWGRGQRLLRLVPPPARPALFLMPAFPVATARAYQWLDTRLAETGPRGSISLDFNHLSDWGTIARMAGNDFEAAVFGEHPALRTAFEALARTGPLLCRMCGSGSTLFAVYRSAKDRDDAVLQIGSRHGRIVSTTVGARGQESYG